MDTKLYHRHDRLVVWMGALHRAVQAMAPAKSHLLQLGGLRGNNSTYIGGHHLVHEYTDDNELAKLKTSPCHPSEYFGPSWRDDFQRSGYQTAVCGRCGNRNPETGEVLYNTHPIQLIRNEFVSC